MRNLAFVIIAAFAGAIAGRAMDITFRLPYHPSASPIQRVKFFLITRIIREVLLVLWSTVYSVIYLREETGRPLHFYVLAANLALFMSLVAGDVFDSTNRNDPKNLHDPNNGSATGGPNAQMTAVFSPSLLLLADVLIVCGWWPVFGIGCFGGFLAELYDLYKLRTKKPEFTLWYSVVGLAMILAGGVLTTFYGIQNVSALLALQIGASTPLIINRLRTGRK